MNAPIREFVQRYAASGSSRLHMPGHKGAGPLGCEAWDITEVEGADALYEASGIIAESEANATSLFGTQHTFYSTEGSSHCIRAMLHLAMTAWREDWTHGRFGSAQGGATMEREERNLEQGRTSVPREERGAAIRGDSAPHKERSAAQGGNSATREESSAAQSGASKLHELCASLNGASTRAACGAGARTAATGDSRRALPRPVALAGRNAHRAFLTAAALCDFDVEWLWPEADVASPCACPITAEGLTRRLDAMEYPPFCVYVTSPDYLGGTLDIAMLAEVCHARGVPLLVDNAHGAYLRFLPERLHPMELGADLCCDSAHKTLPVLTGGAYLHVGRNAGARYAGRAKQALALFGSTSPSYLILQSLDCANVELAGDFPERLAECRVRVDALKALLVRRGFEVLPSEPMKLSLHTDGPRAAALLRAGRVEPELVEREHVVLMFSPANVPEDFARVERALVTPLPLSPAPKLAFPKPPRAMTIREASFVPSERVPVECAAGRVCAAPTAPCPPAICLAVPGERVTPELAALLARCGMDGIAVVRT